MYQEGKKWFITKVQKLGKKGRGIVLCEKFAIKGAKYSIHKIDIEPGKEKGIFHPKLVAGSGVVVTLTSIAASKRGFMYLRKATGFVGGDIIIAFVKSLPRKKPN